MNQKVSPMLVGIFVVGAVILAISGILFFGSGQAFKTKVPTVMYFDGSLRGLDIGAPVLFQGVRIGSVTDTFIRYYHADDRFEVPVFAEIETDAIREIGGTDTAPGSRLPALIDRGLRAQLIMESFVTGKLAIELGFHDADEDWKFVGSDPEFQQIPTLPSKLEELEEMVTSIPFKELVEDARSAIQAADEVLRSEELNDSIRSFDEAVTSITKLADDIDQEVKPLSESVQETLADARQTLDKARESLTNIDARVETVEGSLTRTLDEFHLLAGNVNKELEPTLADLKETTATLRTALDEATVTLSSANDALQPDSPLYHEAVAALEEIASAARAIRDLAELLAEQPESVIQGRP